MSEMGPRQESIMMITGSGPAPAMQPDQRALSIPPRPPRRVDVSTVTIGSSESDRASAWALVGPTTADRAGEASASTKGGLVTLISQD